MTNPYAPLRIYIAAPFEERDVCLELKKVVQQYGVEVTSTWLTDADGNSANMAAIKDRFHDCRCRAVKDFQDIDAADVYVLYKPKALHRKPTTGGHHVELGYALAKGKPCFIIGDRENVFHYLPGVRVVRDVGALLAALDVPTYVEEKING